MKYILTETGIETELPHGTLKMSGEKEHGFRPGELLVASIAGCSGSVFRKILVKQRLELNELEITADVERNPDEANKITKITLHFEVGKTDISLEKLERNLKLARKNCPMVRSVEDSIEIKEYITIKE
ncbi:OsmC family protein [Ornithinibacillus sp. 4-3]|uniref:OsmC family protein n=1 Tax=Ornithinibacillus sp. 4-3 TaxID=3231488 RepID=A0AB39HID6_9BACI